jgi:hypothetical protein
MSAIERARPTQVVSDISEGGTKDQIVEALSNINMRLDKQDKTLKELITPENNKGPMVTDNGEHTSWAEVVKQPRKIGNKEEVGAHMADALTQWISVTRSRPPLPRRL